MFERRSLSDGVFRSERFLSSTHVPESPVHRSEEIQRIRSALEPATYRGAPDNIWVHGPAGAGKSSCVSHVLDELDESGRVQPVRINCWQYNTRPSLLTELLIRVGFPAPRKGKPVDELLSRLREWLGKNRAVILALDEFDQLREPTEVVYDLHHIAQAAEQHLGLVLVSNTHPSAVDLDPRSHSRLGYRPIAFEPYDEESLRGILEERVECAFEPGAVAETVPERIAAFVAGEGGDCRQALNILLRAGREADRERCDQVTPHHVKKVVATTGDQDSGPH